MLTSRKYAILLVCCLISGLSTTLRAQKILDIREVARLSGKVIPVDTVGTAIVDINSLLEIRPNRDIIRHKALDYAGKSNQGNELREKIQRIEKILRNQQQIVDYIRKALADEALPADSLLLLLRQTTGEIRRDPVLRADFNEYNRRFSERVRQDPGFKADRFLFALEQFNGQLDSINQELKSLEKDAQVQFSLRAFRKDKSGGARLHIENFDEFSDGEFFTVNGWVLGFSAEQVEQLQSFRSLADTLNLGAEKAIVSFKNQLSNLLPSLACLKTMPSELRLAAETVPTNVRNILDAGLAGAQAQIDQLTADLTEMSPGQPFNVQDRIANLKTQLDTLVNQTKSALVSLPQTNANLNNIVTCVGQTRADLEKIEQFVSSFPAQYLQKVYLASDDLADEVLAFELDNIPEVGNLNLQYTGRREVGDELLIQALFIPKNDTADRRRNFIVLEQRELKMILAGAHSNTKIGIIMAQPYTLTQDDVSKFRFTPSAALLLKFGNRRSHFYNRFLDPGIGIVTSSPDFDRDGVPEFSAGLTGTLFRDIISLGWSWNFGADRPFYFLGIHLPFNLPGVPVNTIQSNPLPGG